MILANPQQLLKGMTTTFLEALMLAPDNLVGRLATYVSSNSDHEDYSWLGDVQQVTEFVDEVQFSGLSETAARGFLGTNKKFTGGLQVKRDDLSDEKTGGLALRIRDLATRAAMHADEQLAALLVAGTSTLGYDGDNLFSATHPARASAPAQSNLISQTGVTTAAVAADLNSALSALYGMLDEAGLPANRSYRKFFIIYPPAINKAMMEAVTAPVIAQTSNVQFSNVGFDLIAEPLISTASGGDDGDFYVGIQDAPVRGLIYQDREPVSFEALEAGSGSDLAFTKEVYSYKVRKRSVALPGRWQRIVKVQ